MRKSKKSDLEVLSKQWDHLSDEKMKRLIVQLQKCLLYGCPIEDPRGHSDTLSVRVSKAYSWYLAEIKALAPQEWYKNSSDVHRAVLMVGAVASIEILKRNLPEKLKHLEDIQKHMHDLYLLGVRDRTEAQNQEITNIMERMTTATKEDKAKTQYMKDDLDDKMRAEFQQFINGSAW